MLVDAVDKPNNLSIERFGWKMNHKQINTRSKSRIYVTILVIKNALYPTYIKGLDNYYYIMGD